MNPFRLAARHRSFAARRMLAAGLAAVCLLAACGDDDDSSATDAAGEQPAATDATGTEAPSTDAPATDAAATDGGGDDPYGPGRTEPAAKTTAAATSDGSGQPAGGAVVGTAETELGEVLVDADGFTLYGFLNDTEGESTCFDACAETWPPVLVPGVEVGGEPNVGTLDASVFSVVEHPEGPMLKAGDFPLYRYAADTAPGDVNGQDVGGVWYAMAPDGTMITE